MKNILFINHDPLLYGPAQSLLILIKGLREKGYNCYIVVPAKGKLTELLDKEQFNYEVIRFHWWISAHDSGFRYYFKNIFKIDFWKIMVRKPLKVLYNIRVSLPKFKKLINDWNIDVVYNNSMVTPIGILIKLRYKLPLVLHFRETLRDIGLDLPFSWFNYLVKKADAHIFISEFLKTYYTNSALENSYVIYNSLSSTYLQLRIPNNNAVKRFVIVGRISRKKGQLIAIKAVHVVSKKYPNVKLVVVGDGEVIGLNEYINKHNLSANIELTGWDNNPGKYYSSSNCAIICSENEAFGRATIEAMAYGLPVLGLAKAGTIELIQDQFNGYLFQNEEELAQLMIKLIENPQLAQTMGRNAHTFANSKFNPIVHVDVIENIMLRVYNGSKK